MQPMGIPGSRQLLMALAGLVMLGASAARGQTTQAIEPIDRVRPGDSRLGCTELRQEMDRMDRIRASAKADARGVKDDAAAGSAAGLASSLAGVPLVGSLFQMQTSQRSMARNESAQRAEEAAQRKGYLTELYNAKAC